MSKFIFLVIVVAFAGCTREEITARSYPRVRTHPVEMTSATVPVFRGEITFSSSEITDHGFVWDTNVALRLEYAENISLGPASGAKKFESLFGPNIQPGMTYYVKAYARSATHTVYGEMVEFTRP